ncbi:sensor domain-containing diguanylate cyclase [Rhodoplanes roseus]|uniref:GGDEF domain-containing protein n=1 Tax=Rhodoplanes roseus TaxID=29409 RepID=A0A327KUR8_9BRAD|nr:diguanylate cyclase [Rhodoplanes roseus]RAI41957.1 hypothetical protein CH341_20565 [Rhodoplanes roseus]
MRFWNSFRSGWSGVCSSTTVRCLFQPATALGALTIALLWIGIGYQLGLEREKLQALAFQDTRNLARVVEEHVVRSIQAPDHILRLARAGIASDPAGFDLHAFARIAVPEGGVALQLSLIGPDGFLRMSSQGPVTPPLDLSDRRHFQVHRDRDGDVPDISPPVLGRVSGRWSIQLSRSVRTAGGTFLGVLVASLDAGYFQEFYRSIDVGPGGSIVLVGTDGIVRAGSGTGALLAGRSVASWPSLHQSATVPQGSVIAPGPIDGRMRFVSYRAVTGLPLVVYASVAAADAFADNARYAKLYAAVAAGLTLIILIAVAFAVRQRLTLARTSAALMESEAVARRTSRELAATLDNISQGILMVDRDGRVVVVNGRAAQMLGVPEATLAERPSFRDVVAEMRRLGEFGARCELVNTDLSEYSHFPLPHDAVPAVFERTRPTGQTIEVSCVPTPDGGMVRTYTDITERRASERRIAYMALHDPLTGLANRTLFRSKLEHALDRQRSRGEPFAVISVDLDRFKQVNDFHGHPAGDELLRRVAHRLRDCLGEGDVAARLGGDEFAVLALRARDGETCDALVRRMLEAVTSEYRIDGQTVEIGASLGVALAPEDGDGIEALLHAADQAMYRVKAQGRNGVCWAGHAPRFTGTPRRDRIDAA